VGLCSAYSLRQRGYDVTLIDPGTGPKTSTVNAGMIVPSHIIPLASPGMIGVGLRMMLRPKSPFWIRPRLDADLARWMLRFARSCTKENVEGSKRLLMELNSASKEAYLDFERELDGFHIEQKGLLMIAKKEETLEEESHVAAQVRELGLPAEVLDAEQVQEVDPAIQIDAVGGVHYRADCHFYPPQFMAALRARLDAMEVEFRSDTVRHFTSQGVATDGGELSAETVVIAAGAWSQTLAREIGLTLPLQAGKGYSFEVTAPMHRPSVCAILMEGRVAVTPMPGGTRFGGTMEIGPADGRMDARRIQGIQEAIPNYYPQFRDFDFAGCKASVGLRPCSPDGLPYIGRTTRRPNVIVATGHAMMGMSLGPITGRLVAQIAAGEETEIDITALSPDRFDRSSSSRG
jgi:D-amino-acid dehydrogenase